MSLPQMPSADTRYKGTGPPAERAPALYGVHPTTEAIAPGTENVPARVDHGRWIVDCPNCNGAQFASVTDRRFLCCECENIAIGGLWRRVVWPDNWPEIESVLRVRPIENRNWHPEESTDDLRAENAAHDLVET
jgi:hypothetical protein